ncbi:MAG: uroporphyrinogen-III synthase [Gemmatimonas sp.]
MINVDREQSLIATLQGRRVVVTRAGRQADAMLRRLVDLGATALHWPSIAFAPPQDIQPLREAATNAGDYKWIVFTSANAVSAFADQLFAAAAQGAPGLTKIAVVGTATARAVRNLGWRVDFQSAQGSGAALAATLPATLGDRVLFPRADIAAATLPGALRGRGLSVDGVVAYHTLPNRTAHLREQIANRGTIDALTFTSPSTITGFLAMATECGWSVAATQETANIAVVCIGETTASAARDHALHVDTIAAEPTTESMLDAVAQALRQRGTRDQSIDTGDF